MRLRKVVGDLRHYRAQLAALTAVLALAVAGVVAALDARAILDREIGVSFAAAEVPDLALWIDGVDAAKLALARAAPGVSAVDSRRVINTRVKVRDGTWLPMRIIVRGAAGGGGAGALVGRTHEHAPLRALPDALAIEQSGAELVGAGVTTLRLRKPGGEEVELPMAGLVHDPSVAPSTQDRMIYAYAGPGAALALGYPATLDQLLVKMEFRGSTGEAAELGTRLADSLATLGSRPARIEVLAAGHPHGPLMNAMVRVLAILAAIAFTCGAALAGYLVSAWMRREVRVVGILKTLGAKAHHVAAQYLALLVPVVAASLAIGMLLGTALARALVRYEAAVVNIDISSWLVPRPLVLLEWGLALAIALLAMAVPIARAALMRPLAALHDPGIAPPPAAARIAAKVLRLPSSMATTLALRNVWRRPWRTLVMVLALASGGALLLVSKTTYVSIMGAVDRALASEGHDVEVLLQRPQTGTRLVAIAMSVRGVESAEPWRRAAVSASSSPAVETESARFTLVGYPKASRLFIHPLVAGRAPVADDEVLATRSLLDLYPGLEVGRALSVRFRNRTTQVRIAGLIEQIGSPAIYTKASAYSAITGLGEDATAVRVKAASGVPLDALANELEAAFIDAREAPAQVVSRNLIRESLNEHVEVVGSLMRVVALAAALIGAVVLVAAVVFNVAERRREVGILRALGAGVGRIRTLFLIEGAAIMAASVLLASAASLAIARAILDAGERNLLRVAIPTRFSLEGLAMLGAGVLVVMLAVHVALAFALALPARESLASE
jgi:ABC-type antimicrobial peptide transport system permease subunit